MSFVLWLLLGWYGIALVAGVLVGKCIKRGDRG